MIKVLSGESTRLLKQVSSKHNVHPNDCIKQAIHTYDQVSSKPDLSMHSIYDLVCRRQKGLHCLVGHDVINMLLRNQIDEAILNKIEAAINERDNPKTPMETPMDEAVDEAVDEATSAESIIPESAKTGEFSVQDVEAAYSRIQAYTGGKPDHEECRIDGVPEFEIKQLHKPATIPFHGSGEVYSDYNTAEEQKLTVI